MLTLVRNRHKEGLKGLRRRSGRTLCLVALPVTVLVAFAGCSSTGWTQSAFTRAVNNAGSEFAAAAATLQYVHTGRLASTYASASFVNYKTQLGGLDHSLPNTASASEQPVVRHLLAFYNTAWPAIMAPCLAATCNWRLQLRQLQAASAAFLRASSA